MEILGTLQIVTSFALVESHRTILSVYCKQLAVSYPLHVRTFNRNI